MLPVPIRTKKHEIEQYNLRVEKAVQRAEYYKSTRKKEWGKWTIGTLECLEKAALDFDVEVTDVAFLFNSDDRQNYQLEVYGEIL